MLLVFEIIFAVLAIIILQIESIEDGRVGESGVGDGGKWGAKGRLKQQFRLKQQCCGFSM